MRPVYPGVVVGCRRIWMDGYGYLAALKVAARLHSIPRATTSRAARGSGQLGDLAELRVSQCGSYSTIGTELHRYSLHT